MLLSNSHHSRDNSLMLFLLLLVEERPVEAIDSKHATVLDVAPANGAFHATRK